MLLQTFVQLNILLLAAPALAGWAGVTPCHPLLAQAAQAVCRPAAQEQAPSAALSPSAAAVRQAVTAPQPGPQQAAFGFRVPQKVSFALFQPFPRAARAP